MEWREEIPQRSGDALESVLQLHMGAFLCVALKSQAENCIRQRAQSRASLLLDAQFVVLCF